MKFLIGKNILPFAVHLVILCSEIINAKTKKTKWK